MQSSSHSTPLSALIYSVTLIFCRVRPRRTGGRRVIAASLEKSPAAPRSTGFA